MGACLSLNPCSGDDQRRVRMLEDILWNYQVRQDSINRELETLDDASQCPTCEKRRKFLVTESRMRGRGIARVGEQLEKAKEGRVGPRSRTG